MLFGRPDEWLARRGGRVDSSCARDVRRRITCAVRLVDPSPWLCKRFSCVSVPSARTNVAALSRGMPMNRSKRSTQRTTGPPNFTASLHRFLLLLSTDRLICAQHIIHVRTKQTVSSAFASSLSYVHHPTYTLRPTVPRTTNFIGVALLVAATEGSTRSSSPRPSVRFVKHKRENSKSTFAYL